MNVGVVLGVRELVDVQLGLAEIGVVGSTLALFGTSLGLSQMVLGLFGACLGLSGPGEEGLGGEGPGGEGEDLFRACLAQIGVAGRLAQ